MCGVKNVAINIRLYLIHNATNKIYVDNITRHHTYQFYFSANLNLYFTNTMFLLFHTEYVCRIVWRRSQSNFLADIALTGSWLRRATSGCKLSTTLIVLITAFNANTINLFHGNDAPSHRFQFRRDRWLVLLRKPAIGFMQRQFTAQSTAPGHQRHLPERWCNKIYIVKSNALIYISGVY